MSDPDGAMGAGRADAPDLEVGAGGDATGGGSPGDPDAMGADDGRTVEEGAGRLPGDSDEIDRTTDGAGDDAERSDVS